MSTAEQNPAQVLADQIVKRLVSEKLLAEDRFPRFSAALASGKLKSGDWRIALESVGQPKAEQQLE